MLECATLAKQTRRERNTDTHIERKRHRKRNTQRQRWRETDRERDTEKETARETLRKRQREKYCLENYNMECSHYSNTGRTIISTSIGSYYLSHRASIMYLL